MAGQLLIVDPIATNRIVLKARLSSAFYDVAIARDMAQATALCGDEIPDLIVLSDGLPDCGLPAAISQLRAARATADIPIIAVSNTAGAQTRADWLRAGADDVIARAEGNPSLLARLRLHLRIQDFRRDLAARLGAKDAAAALALDWGAEPPGKIGLVAASPARALAWQARLSGTKAGSAHIRVLDPMTVLGRTGRASSCEVFVLDADLGRAGSGHAMLSDLAARGHSRDAALLVVTPDPDGMGAGAAFDLGADGVLADRPDGAAEMAARIEAALRRKRQRDRLQTALDHQLALANTDPLTGLFNRRHITDRLQRMRDGSSLAAAEALGVLILDIDHFKSVNDRHGHATGDAVLIAVAQSLSQVLGDTKALARIGGEEFLIAQPVADAAALVQLGETLRRAIADLELSTPTGERLGVTASLGAAIDDPSGPLSATMARADAALYRSKRTGRNRVSLSEGIPA